MFKSRSHWVSARMSESPGNPLPEAKAEEKRRDPTDVGGIARETPEDRSIPIVAPAPASAATRIGIDAPPAESPVADPVSETRDAPTGAIRAAPAAAEPPLAHVVAAELQSARASARPIEAEPASEHANERAAAASIPDPVPTAPPRDAIDPLMPKVLDDEAHGGANARHALWLVAAAGAVLAIVVLGSLEVGNPDARTRIAAFDAAVPFHSADAKRAMPSPAEMVREAQAKEDARDRVRKERADVREASSAGNAPIQTLQFRKLEICHSAAACGLAAHASPGLRIVAPLEPGLVAAIEIQRAMSEGPVFAPAERAERVANDPPDAASVASAALAAIGEIEVVLLPPKEGSDNAPAEVALRLRDGRELGRITLNVVRPPVERELQADEDEEQGSGTGDGAEGLEEHIVRQAPEGEPGARPAAGDDVAPEAAPAPSASGEDAHKNAKRRSVVRRPAPAAKPKRTPRAEGPDAPRDAIVEAKPQPRGLFNLEPFSQPVFQAAPKKATIPKSGGTPRETSPNDISAQSTPQSLDRPAGVETLMSLGGGFAVDEP